MPRILNRLRSVFGPADVLAVRSHRRMKFVPTPEALEGRIVLYASTQTVGLAAGAFVDLLTGASYVNSLGNSSPNIKSITDASSKSAANPTTGASASFSVALDSVIKDPSSDSGSVEVSGSFATSASGSPDFNAADFNISYRLVGYANANGTIVVSFDSSSSASLGSSAGVTFFDGAANHTQSGVYRYNVVKSSTYLISLQVRGNHSDFFGAGGTAQAASSVSWQFEPEPPPLPDIAMGTASIDKAILTYALQTTGNPASVPVALYQSADQVFDASDKFLAGQTIPTAASGQGTFNLTGFSPDPTRPYLLVVADPNSQIAESNENNNTTFVLWKSVDKPANPFTILTHGFSPLPNLGIPDWARATSTALTQMGVNNQVITDWLDMSNNASPGWTEAAGDVLFARIMWDVQHGHRPFDIHYIGHSRGTVVNSEANKRLAYYDSPLYPLIDNMISSVQFTMLDAHPANGKPGAASSRAVAGLGGVALLGDGLFELEALDPDPVVWDNVTWADAYFQRDAFNFLLPGSEKILNLWGYGHDAPYGIQVDVSQSLTAIELENGNRIGHSELPFWYLETIRANSPERGGFYYAIAGAGWDERPSLPGKQQGTQPASPATIFNGDFRFGGKDGNQIPGWHGLNYTTTAQQVLQLRTRGTAFIEHEPMFIPPGQNELTFDVRFREGRPLGTLKAYFLPARSDENGNLQAIPVPTTQLAQYEIGKWDLASLPSTQLGERQAIINVETQPLGSVGVIRFVVETPGSIYRSIIEIDNIRLQSPSSRSANFRFEQTRGSMSDLYRATQTATLPDPTLIFPVPGDSSLNHHFFLPSLDEASSHGVLAQDWLRLTRRFRRITL